MHDIVYPQQVHAYQVTSNYIIIQGDDKIRSSRRSRSSIHDDSRDNK